jgi:hypothetical protein
LSQPSFPCPPPCHTHPQVIKNHFASEFIYNKYKDLKTCGVIEDDETAGIQKVAEPVGVIAGIVPTTNPTSTAIFKSLLALKTRNAIVMSPHVRAAKSTIAAAKIVRDAAEAAGAPKGLIQWIEKPSASLAGALMRDPGINLILATGEQQEGGGYGRGCLSMAWRGFSGVLHRYSLSIPWLYAWDASVHTGSKQRAARQVVAVRFLAAGMSCVCGGISTSPSASQAGSAWHGLAWSATVS